MMFNMTDELWFIWYRDTSFRTEKAIILNYDNSRPHYINGFPNPIVISIYIYV